MTDKVLKRFEIVDEQIRKNAATYVSGLNPRLHKGKLMVVIYEHVEMVNRDQTARYMANMGEQAERYRKVVARVSDKTGHTPEEICVALHDRSNGKLFDHQPGTTDFHELMKKRLNGGDSTRGMTKPQFSKYADQAIREAQDLCDQLERWATRHFEI